jgi:F-type H+-transporting ATPase subunit gamma
VAKSRDIKRRIKSVKNTAKITHTMELVATAKSKLCTNRIQKAIPYFRALAEIAGQARKAGGTPSDKSDGAAEEKKSLHPLLTQREVKKVALLSVAANRGLCGGYNGNVLRLGRKRQIELEKEGKSVRVFSSGKKALAWMKFQGIKNEGGYTKFEDKPAYADVEVVANDFIRMFLDGEVDRVEVSYTHYLSAGRQVPVVETLLPIEAPTQDEEQPASGTAAAAAAKKAAGAGSDIEFIIEPDPASILDAIFPLQVKLHLYRIYLEAATSEQIARRVAMKNASDNADEVGKSLRMQYNRARQSQITKEILEIIGGAEALG